MWLAIAIGYWVGLVYWAELKLRQQHKPYLAGISPMLPIKVKLHLSTWFLVASSSLLALPWSMKLLACWPCAWSIDCTTRQENSSLRASGVVCMELPINFTVSKYFDCAITSIHVCTSLNVHYSNTAMGLILQWCYCWYRSGQFYLSVVRVCICEWCEKVDDVLCEPWMLPKPSHWLD